MNAEPEIVDAEVTVADLAVREPAPLVRPAADLEQIAQAFADYQAVCEQLLTPADYQKIGRKQFRKRSGWRKLGVAFSIDYELREKNLTWDDDGNVLFAEFVYRAVAPNGRHVDGWGACDRKERAFAHPNHDIPATAETRAKNRAAADLFGMGEVSAEEMGREPKAVERHPVNAPVSTSGSAAEASSRPISQEQVKRLWTIARGRGVAEDDIRTILQHEAGVDSSKDIPRDRYDAVIAAIADWVPFS